MLVLAGGAVAAWRITQRTPGKSTSSSQPTPSSQNSPAPLVNDQFTQEYLRDCVGGEAKQDIAFTTSPIPNEQLRMIEPMGRVYDGHVTPTDHLYLHPQDQSGADSVADIVMPADGTVVLVGAMPSQYVGDMKQQAASEDYRVVVAHNCRYVSIFIHLHRLSDPLKAAVGTLAPNARKDIAVKLKAGDKLGRIGSSADWTVADAQTKLAGFISPNLYQGESWKIHTIDPFTLYTGIVKDQLVAKSIRSGPHYGGKIDYDQRGKLVGNWFREGTNGYSGASQGRYYDGHLSIAPNYIDPAVTIYSSGNWQGKSTQMAVKGIVMPENITTASGTVKLELMAVSYSTSGDIPWNGRDVVPGVFVSRNAEAKGVALVQVLSGEKLKVEHFVGKTAAQVTGFTSAAQIYTR